MSILGAMGQQYMFILLVLLFLGFGLGTWSIIQSIFEGGEPKGSKKGTQVKSNINKTRNQD